MNDKTRRLTVKEAKLNAHECREMAKRSTDPTHAVMLDYVAETWDRIALDLGNAKVR